VPEHVWLQELITSLVVDEFDMDILVNQFALGGRHRFRSTPKV
jgi:hypothetical protein